MAKLIAGDSSIEVKDGDSIIGACESLGVPFSCYAGACTTCRITIVEGAENLSNPTEAEIDRGMYADKRLACQCKIKQGTVKIKW